MPADIGASAQEFSTAVSIFYATYVLSETPWAILLKKLTPRVMMTGLAIVWSLVTIFSGFIQNIAGLYVVRLILGACEGGLFPGLNLYLTMIYRREEQAKRVSYLFVCTAISGAFGGLLAYGILHMDGIAGYEGWRWVYIIEGIFSIIVAGLVWFGLPNNPGKAYFLTTRQKELMEHRQIQRAAYMGSDDFDWAEVKIALKDPKVYISGLIQFCQDILLYGFSTFLPSIISEMGYDTYQTQYLTVPVYAVGGLAFVSLAFLSDRYELRAPVSAEYCLEVVRLLTQDPQFLIFANIFGIVGYILLLVTSLPVGVRFFATFLVAIAVYTGPGLNLTWLNVNTAPHYRRATSIGLQQTIGNTAGIVAGQIYRKAPYMLGNGFSLGAVCISQLVIISKMLYIRSCNIKKDKIANGEIEDTRKVKTGDWALDFRYHL